MAAGILVLTIALADEFVRVLVGGTPAYEQGDTIGQIDEQL